MYKKINIKILLALFVVLLILVLVIFYFESKKGERSFRADIFDADTSKVTSVVIYPRINKEESINIIKKGTQWKIDYHGKLLNADNDIVKNMFSTLLELKPRRIAATERSRWREFEVDDSLSTRVQVLTQKKIVSDLYIGKFSYQQPKNQMQYNYNQRGTMSTCVRLADENIVYVVDGFLSMAFNRNVNDFRNNSIIRSNKSDWTRLSFRYPADSSFTLVKEGDIWMVDGLMADSASVDKYFNSISYLTNSNFVDDQKPLNDQPVLSLKIEGNNFGEPIQVKAFIADTINKYLITSSLNKGAYFSGEASKLTGKIFVGKAGFFSNNE